MEESNKTETSVSESPSVAKTKNSGPSPYLLPAAIVIAGLVIGGAVLLSSNGVGKSLFAKKASAKFQACLASDRHNAKIEADTKDALDAGGTGTPYVLVINSDKEVFPFYGAQPYAEVKATIDEALAAIDGKKNKGATSTAQNVRPVDDTDHVQGPTTAPITMIEYSDFQCPFCERVHPTLKQIMTAYPDKVRWVYRDFPLTMIHPEAQGAAVAAECAAEIGGNEAYWGMVDLLFQNQQQLGQALYLQNAITLKL